MFFHTEGEVKDKSLQVKKESSYYQTIFLVLHSLHTNSVLLDTRHQPYCRCPIVSVVLVVTKAHTLRFSYISPASRNAELSLERTDCVTSFIFRVAAGRIQTNGI